MILTTSHLPSLKYVKSLICISNIYQVCVLSRGFYGNNIRSKNMPKVKPNTAALREVRMKEKTSAQSKNFGPPSEIYLCVLGNGSISSPRALYMFTDHGRFRYWVNGAKQGIIDAAKWLAVQGGTDEKLYLFNCGEGTQRLAHEYKMKLAKLDHIFITHRSWENLGGLLGLSLTIQDIGVPEITLHGPPGIDLLYDATEKFVLTRDLKIVKRNHNEKPYSDSCMEIQYIPIYKPSNSQEVLSSSSESDSSDGHEKFRKLKSSEVSSDSDLNEFESPSRKPKKLRLSRYKAYSDMTMAYVCKGHSKPGHLLIHKCVEEGVPPGPLLGELKNGKDVILPSGRTIYSKDVVSPEELCPLFLVVECPSEEFLDPFVGEEKFRCYQSNDSESSETAALVVHFTPPHVLKCLKYQQWMKRFPKSTCHLIINSDNSTLNSAAIHRIQHKLNLLHPDIFSLLQESEMKTFNGLEDLNIVQANTLDRYYLRPAKGFDSSLAVAVDAKMFIEEATNAEGFNESLKNLQSQIRENSVKTYNSDDKYPTVIFLGTGSSIPSKVRNVSAILVNISANKYLLMDCGEGTQGQIVRLFGDAYSNVLRDIFCIFISHIHADHHLGLIQLLKCRAEAFKKFNREYEPLVLIGPSMLFYWLQNYHNMFEKVSPLYSFIKCSSLQHNEKILCGAEELAASKNFENITLATVLVDHCPDAYGLIMTHKTSKWKLVYSGDTMPCERLIAAGDGCSLLIHEATMEDELADEAVMKKHSTTSQAIQVGEMMKSKYTLLTHFSQRYAKVPVFSEKFHSYIGCAFDNMRVTPNELYILPLLIPALKCLFAEDIEEQQIKGHKRRKKLKLIQSVLAQE